MQKRIFMALLALLLLTVFAAWFVAGPHTLKPLKKELVRSRADVVLTIAKELESSKSPRRRLKALERRLNVKGKLTRENPASISAKPLRKIERDEQILMLFPGRRTPIATLLESSKGPLWLIVSFPVDLETPIQKLWLGLLIVLLGAVAAAVLVTRWSLRPLQSATVAMNKMANGELSHRIDTAIGQPADAFNQMADRIEQLIVGQRQLVAAISHELRTPLTRLQLQAELLELSEHQRNMLQQDITELDGLIETLLLSSKLESGSFALRRQQLNLWELLMSTVGDVELEDRELLIEVPKDLVLHADPLLLKRVLLNLLTNAQRYTPRDCSILIAAQRDAQCVRIQFQDSGPGVSPELLEQLFRPFWRAEQSRSKHTGGHGLGLMLVQRVVSAHGGKVSANNIDPTGLSIAMDFPLA